MSAQHMEIQGCCCPLIDCAYPFLQQDYRQGPFSAGQLSFKAPDPIQPTAPFSFQRSLTTARTAQAPTQLQQQFQLGREVTPAGATATQRRGSEPGIRAPPVQQPQVQGLFTPAPAVQPPVPVAAPPATAQVPPKPPVSSTAGRWGKAFKLALSASKEPQAPPTTQPVPPAVTVAAPHPAPPSTAPVLLAPGAAFQLLPSLSLSRAGTSSRSTRYSTLENILEAELEAEYEALQVGTNWGSCCIVTLSTALHVSMGYIQDSCMAEHAGATLFVLQSS
jgi:hypothetical protein